MPLNEEDFHIQKNIIKEVTCYEATDANFISIGFRKHNNNNPVLKSHFQIAIMGLHVGLNHQWSEECIYFGTTFLGISISLIKPEKCAFISSSLEIKNIFYSSVLLDNPFK